MSGAQLHVVKGPKVEGSTGRCAAAEAAAAEPVSRASLGYYAHTGTVSLYRHGFHQTPPKVQIGVCEVSGLPIYGTGRKAGPSRGKRGRIEGFSSRAAGRLRHWLLTQHRPGGQMWDVTLTIPGDVNPDEWDTLRRRISKRWERGGFAVVWRVELQKRGTPHLHCVVWTPASMSIEKRNGLLYIAWWECLPEEKRFAAGAWKHATHVKGPYTDIEQSPKWLAYVAAHASKRKKEQLGWKGKQWGIINRELFSEREPMLCVSLSRIEEKKFNRTLSRYLFAKSREHRHKLRTKGIKARSRLRRLFFPSGCKKTRLIAPELVRRMLEHAKDSPILAKPSGHAAARAATTESPPLVCQN